LLGAPPGDGLAETSPTIVAARKQITMPVLTASIICTAVPYPQPHSPFTIFEAKVSRRSCFEIYDKQIGRYYRMRQWDGKEVISRGGSQYIGHVRLVRQAVIRQAFRSPHRRAGGTTRGS
jgi:hypothetical protein